MTGYKKVFLDTAPLIYFLDDNEQYADRVEAIFEEILSSEAILQSSVITSEEYLVYPNRTGNREKIRAFYEFISDCHIQMYPITEEIAEKAAQIRADYASFKAMDALQLATAITTGCDILLTNDRQLCQFTELRIVVIGDWR